MRVGKAGFARRTAAIAAAALLAAALSAPPPASAEPLDAPPPAAQAAAPHVPGELIVRFKEETGRSLARSALDSLGPLGRRARVDHWFDIVPRLSVVDLPAGTSTKQALEEFDASPDVAFAEPNYLSELHSTLPNDYFFRQQWSLSNTGQQTYAGVGTPGADTGAARAWDGITDTPASTIGIIDTGIDGTHPDLAANFAGQTDFSTDPPSNGGGDPFGHGTGVAGVAGAVGNNNLGISGVAWRTQLVGLKVFDEPDNVLPLDEALLAYQAAWARQLTVVNVAFGHPTFSQAEYDAIKALEDRTVVSVSAGNAGVNVDPIGTLGTTVYPCSYAGLFAPIPPANLICVGGTDKDDQRVSGSDWGPRSVGISAPGLDVLTTYRGDYVMASGTSFAAPFVTGAAALTHQRFPTLTPPQIVQRLIATGDPLPTLAGYTRGNRLNIWRAVGSPPPRPVPPKAGCNCKAGDGHQSKSAAAAKRKRCRKRLRKARKRCRRAHRRVNQRKCVCKKLRKRQTRRGA